MLDQTVVFIVWGVSLGVCTTFIGQIRVWKALKDSCPDRGFLINSNAIPSASRRVMLCWFELKANTWVEPLLLFIHLKKPPVPRLLQADAMTHGLHWEYLFWGLTTHMEMCRKLSFSIKLQIKRYILNVLCLVPRIGLIPNFFQCSPMQRNVHSVNVNVCDL